MTSSTKSHNIVDAVACSTWFSELPGVAHSNIAEAGRIKKYNKNSYLFTTGEVSAEIYCILSGRIRISISSAIGQQFAITDLEPQAWLGEQVLAGDLPRVLDAQALENSTLLVIPRQALRAIGETYPQMYKAMFIDHILRSRGVYRVLAGMAFYPLRSRLAERLLALIDEHGKVDPEGVFLDVKLSQNDYAQLSLGSRQRVNKIFGEWRDRGIVTVEGSRLLIRDLPALQAETELSQDPV